MSLCDTCKSPGHCCKGFVLWGVDRAPEQRVTFHASTGRKEAAIWAKKHGLPYLPKESWVERSRRVWRWFCPHLRSDGRCGVYETRPQICRDYEAGSDELCVMHEERSA